MGCNNAQIPECSFPGGNSTSGGAEVPWQSSHLQFPFVLLTWAWFNFLLFDIDVSWLTEKLYKLNKVKHSKFGTPKQKAESGENEGEGEIMAFATVFQWHSWEPRRRNKVSIFTGKEMNHPFPPPLIYSPHYLRSVGITYKLNKI